MVLLQFFSEIIINNSSFLHLGNISVFLGSIWDGDSLENQTFSFDFFHRPKPDEKCDILDPATGSLSHDNCDSFRGAVCQSNKGDFDSVDCGFRSSFFVCMSIV